MTPEAHLQLELGVRLLCSAKSLPDVQRQIVVLAVAQQLIRLYGQLHVACVIQIAIRWKN